MVTTCFFGICIGGRQLDSAPASIEALSEIVNALKGTDVEVYLDGGIRLLCCWLLVLLLASGLLTHNLKRRKGSDIFKALAIGAKAVFIGRPMVYGLFQGGESGLADIMRILKEELSLTMALAGTRNIKEITATHIRHESSYFKL